MPPKAKFTREEMIEAALSIAHRDGVEAITARALAKELNSSSCPIFTIFENMEEVLEAVENAAKALYKEYVEEGLAQELAFKGVGMQYIRFAMEEPKLFQLLFMKEQPTLPELSGVLPIIDESYDKILQSICKNYTMTEETARKLYYHLWIYTHGIATLCATKTCRFAPEEINELITDVFISILKKCKEDEKHD